MQTTSATWKALWASGSAWLETAAVIGGVTYSPASAPVVNRALMQNGLGVGNAVSATCQFSLRTADSIPKSAEVLVKMRLTDGTTASEWLPLGTFYISHRSRDPVTGVLTLECYDALLKGNAVLTDVPWTTGTGEVMTTGTGEWIYFRNVWPRKMGELLDDIALLLGVELDPGTQVETGSAYVIQNPGSGTSINALLGKIAAANGGNFIMSPEGKLRLVPVVSAAGAASAGTAVEVSGVIGDMALNGGGTVTGIRYSAGDDSVVVGDESGIVIEADVSAAVASALYSRLTGVTYRSFGLQGAVYDPAAELGDYVRAGANGDVNSVLCSETAVYGPMFRGDIGAPEPNELSDEYPYIGQSARALSAAKLYADQVSAGAAQALDNSLTQQEIFDRLTDGGLEQGLELVQVAPSLGAAGEKKLYLNLDYARFGKLVADFIQGGTLTLGGLDNVNGELRVLDGEGNAIGTWDKDGITLNDGSINGADGENYWLLSGNDPVFVAKKGIIGDFTLANGKLSYVTPSGAYEMSLSGTGISSVFNNLTTGDSSQLVIYGGRISYSQNGNGKFQITAGADYFYIRNILDDSYPLEIFNSDNSGSERVIIATKTRIEGNTTVTGDFTVSGTKSRAVETDQYSRRLLYCYETPSPMFGDVGEGVIGEDGRCYVWLDPVFAQTVATGQYQVFLQAYGDEGCWVKERHPGYFVAEGSPGLAFGWEIKAKQRDYDQKRLERDIEPFVVRGQSYGADAAQYISELQKGRVSA